MYFCLDIASCLENELNEFPLRMRDWLKNVLVTLYERDEENNLLTEKQKLRVSSTVCSLLSDKNKTKNTFKIQTGQLNFPFTLQNNVLTKIENIEINNTTVVTQRCNTTITVE